MLSPIPLKRRVLNAGAWSLAGLGLSQAIRFGSNLLMTRLLVPDMFGVMAIATVVMVGLAMFSDLGLKQSIVQSERNDPAFLNTAWVVQILRGVLLCFIALGIGLLLFVADRIGIVPTNSVYADPRLPYVLAILSFAVAVSGFNSTKMFEASRQLALRRITLIDLAAQISGLTCMLAWVAVDRSIWALVAGNFCWSVTMMLLSHAWLPGTPNCWAWDKSAFQEIFHFGKWIFTSSILSFLVSNGDRLLLGGMVDTTVLGVYVIAFLIVSSVEAALIRIIGAVTFPALSEIVRERPAHLKTNYYRLHAVVASFAYFCSGVLMMSGQSLINVLYDARYAQAGWMVEVLASALVIAPFQVSIQCFMALGKPQLNSSIFAVRLVSLFVAMPVGFHFFGLPGALWASVSSQFLCLPMIIFYNVRHGLFDLRQELLLLPVVLAGMGAGSLLAFLSRNYP